ncbi:MULTISPECIES: hypothetical protein [unclassified Tolypothrix]|uniref:hypothetical protein n=1 Tax=unclassified Tolypothrix TaxID=2649714 RepID=UPI0005EAA688|nr:MULTISPECIES: hypothetical protein [unclassified Tolypothrix]EKE96692.1 hypothetical protein FDUTEX481_06446 [Tolypothrix sp. PCC 7601]BAY95859.1 chromosome segregation ATPase-like protein [Microchaete diplosiphon NIES-3275]
MQTVVQNISWTGTKDAINIFGLLPDKFYSLFCWNLLLPDSKPVEIQVPLLQKGSNKIEVPLNLSTGIYHIQLIWGQQLPENLGWWCGSSRYDLPQATEEDEVRENYCYTILGNSESKEALIAAVRQLNLDFDIKQLQAGISSLESHQYYFPEWLDAHSLLDKLKGLLDFLSPESVPKENNLIMPIMPTADSDKFPTPIVKTVEHGNWYLVTVRSKKREVFLKYLELSIKQNQLQDLILKIEIPQDSVYEDLVLLNISNFKTASTHLQKIENFQSIERKPLNPEQVTRMLGVR